MIVMRFQFLAMKSISGFRQFSFVNMLSKNVHVNNKFDGIALSLKYNPLSIALCILIPRFLYFNLYKYPNDAAVFQLEMENNIMFIVHSCLHQCVLFLGGHHPYDQSAP